MLIFFVLFVGTSQTWIEIKEETWHAVLKPRLFAVCDNLNVILYLKLQFILRVSLYFISNNDK